MTLRIDRDMHVDYTVIYVSNLNFLKVHVYFFDSLGTTIREFRTIKSCEFFSTADIILNPTLINLPNKRNQIDPLRKMTMMEFIINNR